MSATKTNRPAKANDWSLSPRGVVSGTAMTTASIVLTGAAGQLAHINPVFAGGGAVAGALAHLIASAHNGKYTPGAIMYRLGCWAGAGGWLTWAFHSNTHVDPADLHAWNPGGLAALAIAAIGAGIMAGPVGGATRDEDEHRTADGRYGTEVALSGGGEIGREWIERIRRVCRFTVQVDQVTDYPTRTGYYVHVLLPIGGKTIDDIASQTKRLATDARLLTGCAIDVTEGARQGEVVISVPTVNRLLDEIPYAPDHTPRSIYDPVPLGEYQDGSIVGVPLRQLCALAVGKTGSGKTTLLDLFTDGIGHCTDALVWHIDLNGGGMTWSWLQPWINGQTDRPAIDWAAATLEEALLMVQTAYAIGLDRKGSYNHLKAEQNTRLMPLSPGLPEIVIIVDEGKKVLSNTATGIPGQIRDALIKISDELRDAGIRLVVSGLRGTADTIDTAFKVQSGVKIGMPVDTDAELAYLFDWNKGLKVTDLPTMGCAYVQYDQQPPRMWKTRHILPGHITESATVIARHRPDLDAHGQRIGGSAYANRHQQMREFFSTTQPNMPGQTGLVPAGSPAPAAPAVHTSPVPVGRPHLSVVSDTDPANWPAPGDLTRPTAPSRPADWPEPGQLTGHPAGPAALTAAPAGPVQPVPELVRRALAAFDEAGDDRLSSEGLARALGIRSADELADLLRDLGITPLRNQFERRGKRYRGYAREHFAQAAERITSGALAVPEKVGVWPAA